MALHKTVVTPLCTGVTAVLHLAIDIDWKSYFPGHWVHIAFSESAHCEYVYDSTGPRLNIKTILSMYGDFHVKDKTVVRTSYL